jgi:hypothetical protein
MLRNIICLVVVLGAGCTRIPERQRYLHVWESPRATLEERVAAVTNLVASGASDAEVQAILGRGHWCHYEGPPLGRDGLLAYPPSQTHESMLEYRVHGGTICLSFSQANGKMQFAWVGIAKPGILTLTPSGKGAKP